MTEIPPDQVVFRNADRGGHAADLRLVLLPVERMAVVPDFLYLGKERFYRTMRLRRERMKLHSCRNPLQFASRKNRESRLADTRAIGRRRLAYLRAHTHGLPAFHLVDVDDFGLPQQAEMHRLARQLVQVQEIGGLRSRETGSPTRSDKRISTGEARARRTSPGAAPASPLRRDGPAAGAGFRGADGRSAICP